MSEGSRARIGRLTPDYKPKTGEGEESEMISVGRKLLKMAVTKDLRKSRENSEEGGGEREVTQIDISKVLK